MTKTTTTKTKTLTPRAAIEKIVVNAGVGRLSQQGGFEEKILPQVMNDLATVTGQKPKVCRARRSIAGFKIREGQVVGLQVTLRGKRMVDFFERLVTIVLPRVRDFRGLDPKVVDAGGTLSIGFREQLVFSEINPEESTLIFPFGVNIVPIRKHRESALADYRELGIRFKKGDRT
jgi:large subunit ribosomal protein L5